MFLIGCGAVALAVLGIFAFKKLNEAANYGRKERENQQAAVSISKNVKYTTGSTEQ